MSAIFISYRRDDTEGQAGRLFDELSQHFGHDAVFMDVAAIEPGRDFRQAIDEHVASCGVLLAVIGKGWLTARDAAGARRLDDPLDFVRLETASALKRDIPVVPVLVQGAHMPRTEDLPGDLQALAYRNAVELTHARWDSDVEVLVKALRALVQGRPAAAPVVVAARSGRGWAVAGALALVLGLGAGAYAWHRHTAEEAARAAAALAQARRSAALADEARRQAEADRANLEKLAAAQRAKSQADAEARWKAEAERAAAQRALAQAASKPASPALPAAAVKPITQAEPSAKLPTAPTGAGPVPSVSAAAATSVRPTSTSTQPVAPRIRWRAGHFPPPNAGDLVYAILAGGDPACASYDGRSCLWGTAEKDIEFARLRPLACGTAHKAVYGSTGYEDPRHWCNLARKAAAP